MAAGEKEAQQKKLIKAEKKKQKENNQQRLGVSKTSKKTKKGGIRIRKGVTVKVMTDKSPSSKETLQSTSSLFKLWQMCSPKALTDHTFSVFCIARSLG